MVATTIEVTWSRPSVHNLSTHHPLVQASLLEPRSAGRPSQTRVLFRVRSSQENALEFDHALLTLPARHRALQVRSTAQAAARDLEEDIIALHEDGVSLSYVNEKKRVRIF